MSKDSYRGKKKCGSQKGGSYTFYVTNASSIPIPNKADEATKKKIRKEDEQIHKMDLRIQELYRSGIKETEEIFEKLQEEKLIPPKYCVIVNEETGASALFSLKNRIDAIKSRDFRRQTKKDDDKDITQPEQGGNMKVGTISGFIDGGGRGFRRTANNSQGFGIHPNKPHKSPKTDKEKELEQLRRMVIMAQELFKSGVTDSKEIAIKLVQEGLIPKKLFVKVDGKTKLRVAAIDIIKEATGQKDNTQKQKDTSKDGR